MIRFLLTAIIGLFVLSSCSRSYFIVRHAEKAPATNMSSDVPLSEEGKKRAERLQVVLHSKRIAYIYSTNTLRTKSTAQPTADFFKVPIETYGPFPDSSFISLLKTKKKNTLIVGHSNTIDDVVNMLMGKKTVPGDLPETEYNKLFIVTLKGKKATFEESLIFPSDR